MKGFFFLEEDQADTILQYYYHTVDATVDTKWALAKGVTHTFTDINGVSRVARAGELFNSVYVKNEILLGPLVTGTAANDSFGSMEPITQEFPVALGTAGQVLTVNADETGTEWATP